MPSGPKKRKAAKRNHHMVGGDNHHQQPDSPTSPNASSLLPLIQPQGNGREKRPVVVEDECEETFETPRFQPETPRFPPETPYYSMESIKMGRIDEIIVPSELSVDLVGGNSTGLDLEIPSNGEEISKVMKLEESENSNASQDGECLKEVKLDESVSVTEEEQSIEKEVALEKSEIEDKSVAVVDEERTPNASTRQVDVSSSNEKEVKVVPWSDEEIPAVNRAVNGDVEVVPSEKGGIGDRIVERESQEGEGLEEETTVENLGAKKEQTIPLSENLNNIVESVREMLPQIDVEMINNKLDKTVEKSSLTFESPDLITEEATQGSKAYENLESVVGASPVLSHVRVKEATSWSLDAEKINIAQRKEVAAGPAVVRRATIWNCCGLLEFLTSSDRQIM